MNQIIVGETKRLKINSPLKLLKSTAIKPLPSEQNEGYKLSCLIELCRTINSTSDSESIIERSMRIVSDFLFAKKTILILISNELDASHKMYSLSEKTGNIRKISFTDNRFHQLYAAIGNRPGGMNISLSDISKSYQGKKELYVHPVIAQSTLLGYLVAERKNTAAAVSRIDTNIMQTWTEHLGISILNIRMHEMANRDFLTDLYLRRYFMEKAEKRLQEGNDVSLILFDLDHFKGINDRFGHHVGDEVLRETARVIKESVRKVDLTCRFGGEEFAILVPGSDGETARSISKRIKKRLGQIRIGNCKNITASFGISEVSGTCNFFDLYKKVDKALYSAKSKGRNRIEFADIDL